MIRVLVADDHAIVRRGLTQSLERDPDIKVVAEASNGREAVDKALESQPDVALMDIFMPVYSGLEATAALATQLPQTKVLILTVSENEGDIFQAMELGAHGYLLKSASIDDIVAAVRQAAEGYASLSPYVARKLLVQFRTERTGSIHLSQRELEVLKLAGEGLTNREIADRLVVNPGTVKTYLQRILEKLHLKNRAQAMAYALRHGLVDTKSAE